MHPSILQRALGPTPSEVIVSFVLSFVLTVNGYHLLCHDGLMDNARVIFLSSKEFVDGHLLARDALEEHKGA